MSSCVCDVEAAAAGNNETERDMTTTKTTTQKIESVRASAVPGDDLRRLTRPVRCVDGTVIRAGVEYRPFSHGNDGVTITVISHG